MDKVHELLRSVSLGDHVDLENFLLEGGSVDVQDFQGTTPLQIASASGFDNLINLLLSNEAAVDLPNSYGWTPLMLAARYGHTSTISLLLKSRAKINVFNKLGLTPIAAAVWSGQLAAVKLLLQAGAVIDQTPLGVMGPSESDLTPVMVAAHLGYDAILHVLLEKGAPVNHVSTVTGWSPLILAACSGQKQAVQSLVGWGADLSVVDACGRTALDIALLRGHREVRAYLENIATSGASSSATSKWEEILEAVQNGNRQQVELILKDEPGSVCAVDAEDGSTPLMLASKLGHIDIVKSIMFHDAELNVRDSLDGWTALMHAVFNGHSAIVKFLLEKGADIHVNANNGYTVLDLVDYIDDSEGEIVQALSAKLRYAPDVTKPELLNSATVFSMLSKKASSTPDTRTPTKRSSQSSRLKGWTKSVTSRLQTFLPRRSSKQSDVSTIVPAIQVSDHVSTDEVFEESGNSENSDLPRARLSLSALRSPNRHLAHCLRKHSMAPVTPPLLPCSSGLDDVELALSQKRLTRSRQSKGSIVALSTPNLLKNISKNRCSRQYSLPVMGSADIAKEEQGQRDSPVMTTHLHKKVSKPSSRFPSRSFTADNLEYVSLPAFPEVPTFGYANAACSKIESDLSESANLTGILEKKSLQKYVGKFREQEVDLEAFQYLTEEDLSELGIDTMTSREKLLSIIGQLQALSNA